MYKRFQKFVIFSLLIILVAIINCSISRVYAVENTNNKVKQVDTLLYVNLPFWQKFNDENLTNNLITVYKNNNDLRSISYKIKQSERLVKISLSNELPHIGFDGYAGRIFSSSDEVFGDITIPNYAESHFLFPLTMNYEIDIWGENRLKTKSQAKQMEMMQQEERALYIALTSAFASDYYNLIKVDKLIEIQNKLLSTQNNIVIAVKNKYEKGTATINDVILTEKALSYLKEEKNSLEDKKDVLKNQMNVYLADRDFSEIKITNFDRLKINTYIPNEISIDVLSNRPDWVKQELRLKKIGYDVKIAKKDFLPKFNLVGTLGFNFYDIAHSTPFMSSLGVAPSMDIFDGGRKFQILKLQKYKYSQALEDYNKIILVSMQETNDALYGLKTNNKDFIIAKDRFCLDKHEMYLLQKKSQIGMADNLDLLIKQEQLLISQKQAVAYKVNNIIASINLYKALGGYNFINLHTSQEL